MKEFGVEKRKIVAIAVSILAMTEILDATIVSVSLPNIMGSIGANTNQASWLLTSYIIAAAIFMPLAGLVADKFGRKQVMLYSTVMFCVASIMCGLSTSLTEMVIFRILQGMGGAFLPTLAQGYIVDNFEANERSKIMTFYSLCCVMGPVLGPILGGTITEYFNWRWIFYVNIPVCIIGFTILFRLMEKTKKKTVNIDYMGFVLLALGVGLVEYFINQGNNKGWFQSNAMIVSLVFGVLFLIFFIWRGSRRKTVIDFNIFKDKNFNICCLILFLFYVAIMAVMSYFPTMLQDLYNFPTLTSGLMTSPRGIAALITAPIVMKLSSKINARVLLGIGIKIFVISTVFLTEFSPVQGQYRVLIPVVLQGIGMTTVLIMLAITAYRNVPKHLSDSAAGMYGFFRNIGNSIGTAIAATIISTQTQVNWNHLSGSISNYSQNYKVWSQNVAYQGLQQLNIASNIVNSNSTFISYLDVFYFSLVLGIILIFLPFLLKKFKINNNSYQTMEF
ncbi:MAG: DHA2 family efflux MFS transporter permease subunit [bacterium]|nr:DHA2 family efflux MFS transporter permease subunit [bacterium]